jgi:hypothetical protein
MMMVALAAGFTISISALLTTRADREPAPRVAPRGPVPIAAPRPRAATPAPRSAGPPGTSLPVRQAPPPQAEPAYRVAIVFDDAGGSVADVEVIIGIGRPVAVAVLPGLTHSEAVARRARAAGLEVLLHLPVEAHDDTKALGPGGVTAVMSDAEIHAAVRAGLTSVPGAVGVNNHMGSKGTADRRVVRAILEVVRDRRLFFLDSRTTVDTVVEPVAAELGVPVARRLVFLDNDEDEGAIREQVRRLIALARERGAAIAIGHAQRLTPRVVASMVAEIERAGVAIVPVSTLMQTGKPVSPP